MTEVEKALTSKDHELLTFIEQEYLLHGMVPTKEATVTRGVCSAVKYDAFFANPLARKALLVRGISLTPNATGVLTPEQLASANLMLDLRDNRSQRNKLKDLGVPTQKWEAWLRDPAFQSYLQQRAENLLGDNLHESHLALVDRVRSGDVNAIKYYNEITGRYIPASTAKVDVNAVLMRVLEIIQKYVRDPEVLSGMAEELLALSTINPNLLSARPPMKMLDAAVIDEDDLGTTSAL